MAPQAPIATAPDQDLVVEQRIRQLRELYADAPELGRVALETELSSLKRELADILSFAEGGAKRLRGLQQLPEGNFQGADRVAVTETVAADGHPLFTW